MRIFDIPMELDECNVHCAGHCTMTLPCVDKDDRFFSLISVTSGSGFIHTFGKTHSIKSGYVFLAFPYEKYRIESERTAELEYDLLSFSLTSKKQQKTLSSIKLDSIPLQERIWESNNVSSAVKTIYKEFEQPKVSKERTSLLCSQVIVCLSQKYEPFKVSIDNGDDAIARLCILVMNYIDSHVFEIKNLSQVASVLGYNYCYLSSLFRKTTGNTIKNYFSNKKMSVASQLLSDKKKTVSYIAKMLNYSGVYAFSKAFKTHFGVSPIKYRSSITNQFQ